MPRQSGAGEPYAGGSLPQRMSLVLYRAQNKTERTGKGFYKLSDLHLRGNI